jgi:hypothetical protein
MARMEQQSGFVAPSHCPLRKLNFLLTQTWTSLSFLLMVECVGCRQTLKNGKAYSNHQRACKKYKAAGALRLRQMQLNKAKKVERAQALQSHEEPQGIVTHDDHIQDLNDELVVVS